MSIDFNDVTPPAPTFLLREEGKQDEDHQEPADESLKTSVVGAEHPIFSQSGLKDTLNIRRIISGEDIMKGEIDLEVMEVMLKQSIQTQMPFDILASLGDIKKGMDAVSSDDISGIADQALGIVEKLVPSLGRQPKNAELLLGFVMGNADPVKSFLEKVLEAPYEKAEAFGTEIDQRILNKKKFGQAKPRNNKEVLQFFEKRMIQGLNVFPHLPILGGK